MKIINITFCLLFLSIGAFAQQDKDFSLAKVGKKVLGVYIFVACEPANEYDYIATINVRWHEGDPDKSFLEIIERGKKKYPNFNAVIFKNAKFETADLVKFKDLEISGGGFRVGDHVVYKEDGKPKYGKIIQLDNPKQKAGCKYFDEYGEEKLNTIAYSKLSIISTEEYDKLIEEQNTEIQKHKFTIGQKTSYVDDKKTKYGEVVNLDNNSHKASIKYLNVFGEQKNINIRYLDLEKVTEDKFQKEVEKFQQEEIPKYKFKIGEKVSWSKGAIITKITNKSEIIQAEIIAINDLEHKATIKYLNKDNIEKQETVSYLNLSKLK